MVDIVTLVQSIGVWSTLALGVMGLLYLLARANLAGAKADSHQQEVVTQMALIAQERAIKLEEARYLALVKTNQLTVRVQRLETELQRLPQVEAEVQRLKKALDIVMKERDAALVELQSERLRNAELMGRIAALEQQIIKLEEQLRRLTDETNSQRGNIGDVVRSDDDSGDSSDDRSDAGSDPAGDGERSGHSAV